MRLSWSSAAEISCSRPERSRVSRHTYEVRGGTKECKGCEGCKGCKGYEGRKGCKGCNGCQGCEGVYERVRMCERFRRQSVRAPRPN